MNAISEAAAVGADEPRAPVEGILGAIGATPLVALRRLLPRPDIEVWAKHQMPLARNVVLGGAGEPFVDPIDDPS